MLDCRRAVRERFGSARWRRLLHPLLCIALGGVFVYAGAAKLGDPLAFADSVASFNILPNAVVVPLALGLPVFEIIVGGLLISGWHRATAGLAILLAMLIFTAALAAALKRGIVVDCGCFGSSIPSLTRMRLDLGRDILLLAGAFLVYRRAAAETGKPSQRLDSHAA